MPMDPSGLADEIKEALGHGDQETSDQSKGMAKSIIDELQQNGLVTVLPGGVTGDAPPSGGPLLNGAASGGKILALLGPSLASRMQLDMGLPSLTPQVIQMASGITNHITLEGLVSFDSGKIIGPCTNTPTSPGPLAGAGSKGKISGLDPDAMATLIAIGLGGPATDETKNMAKAIVNHIQDKAEVTFATPTIVGLCSAGGGPVLSGAGNGGRIF